MKPVLVALALLALLALLTCNGSANPAFLEKEQSLQFLAGKRRQKRDLYHECYAEGCTYEEVYETFKHKAHADAYWNQYQDWRRHHN